MLQSIAQGGSASPKTMPTESPKARILGGKATLFANALRSRRGDRST